MPAGPAAVLALVRAEPLRALRRVPHALRLYPQALAARRVIRARVKEGMTAVDTLAFTSTFRWGDKEITASQIPAEATGLIEILRRDPPRTVLEIGTLNGGTLFLWAQAAAPDALLISIDLFGSALGTRSPQGIVLRSFARHGQRIELLFRTDSHDPRTRARVERLLGTRPVDFLFIDGDHSYDGVRADFELYAPLVRPGGLVAFHDVSPTPEPRTVDVLRFWQEFTQEHDTEEIVAPGPHLGCGIGLYRVPIGR